MAQSTIGEESSASGSGKPPQVEIYTWQFCPYCIRAKALLDRKGISYSEYRIDGDQEARSRIEDTEYAQATSNFAKRAIIQQAASAMLAQANQSPEQVLQLLRAGPLN